MSTTTGATYHVSRFCIMEGEEIAFAWDNERDLFDGVLDLL